jgi:rubrerythrin
MAFSQVKDLLKRAIEFHALLRDFYLKIEKDSEKDSVKLLVNYLARHEKVLEDLISQITAKQEKQITGEWLKYEPEFATCRCFEEMKINKDSGVDEVIDAGLQLNQCLINLYHHTTEIAPTQEIKELFSSLEIEEIAEKKKLSRMRGM